jgi:hypothetical protein
MAKSTGIGAGMLVGGYDLSGDIGAVSRIASPRTVLDLTAITQESPERALAYKDGAIDFNSYFNPSAGRAHPVLGALPTADTSAMYLHRRTHGAMAACMVAKQVTYDAARAQDGSLIFSTSTVANAYGLEWGDLLSEGVETYTAADSSASLDDGAASSFGLQAYLQVTAFTGTDVTFAIQSSSDNGAGDAFANVTGGVFTQVTAAPDWERIQTARNASIERYLRVAATGTFSSVTFAIAYVRNPYTVNF